MSNAGSSKARSRRAGSRAPAAEARWMPRPPWYTRRVIRYRKVSALAALALWAGLSAADLTCVWQCRSAFPALRADGDSPAKGGDSAHSGHDAEGADCHDPTAADASQFGYVSGHTCIRHDGSIRATLGPLNPLRRQDSGVQQPVAISDLSVAMELLPSVRPAATLIDSSPPAIPSVLRI